MTAPKFQPGDVVTWTRGDTPCAGVVTAAKISIGEWVYLVNGGSMSPTEDELTLLHRPEPPPVRDPVREAGYPWRWVPDGAGQFLRDVNSQTIIGAQWEQIVALSRLPGVLHELYEGCCKSCPGDPTEHQKKWILSKLVPALESVGVKL